LDQRVSKITYFDKYEPGALICAPEAILDAADLKASIAALPEDGFRDAALELLKTAELEGRAIIGAAFKASRDNARATIRSYAYLTDQLIRAVMDLAIERLHPLPNPTASQRISVIAVGGSGRAEMAPFSDVDLLFLTPYKQTAWGESLIESVLYILWDLRLKVGYSVRTVADCVRFGRDDITVRTSLLENRYLWGDKDLARELDNTLWTSLFANTGAEFTEAKLRERSARHKQHGARYKLEPNIKEGKGGLRDLQTLYWIGKYLYNAKSTGDLIEHGVLTKAEHAVFERAEAFLWTVRCHLHLLAKRPSEVLTFDVQVEIAEALGFEDDAGQRAVEQFMQQYFRHATAVGELTRVFLTALETNHIKKAPTFREAFLNVFSSGPPKVADGFLVENGRLNVADKTMFKKDPVSILRLFSEGLRTGVLIHPGAMLLVKANLNLIDEKMRRDPEANKIFLDLLLGTKNPERPLRRMNELGVLGAFVPEFERIVAMMQFNVYHHYTVDEHTIQCISNLSMIERRELTEDLPVASGILEAGVDRRVLFVALLLHDIGKGLPEDHSVAGARIAERICPRFGLSDDETETVVWLVRNHLLMSDVAQKRDISDARTVEDFAALVESRTRLKLLTVLTVCDIRGVGPGVWNNWKAVLLRDLYRMTNETLSAGTSSLSKSERVEDSKAAFAEAAADWEKAELSQVLDIHYDAFWMGLDTDTQLVLAGLGLKAEAGAVEIDMRPEPDRDATRAAFAMQDHPGIFSRLTGALALVGANVVDAKTFTSSTGIAASVFWIQDSEGKPYEKSRLSRLKKMIERTLAGELVAREALKEKDKVKKRDSEFIVPTQISFDNDGSEIFTIIEVDTLDRPGLLHDLARTLTACNLSIASATIATYGKQAVDTFYVKDLFGLKMHAKSKQATIERALRQAIEPVEDTPE